MIKDKQNWIKLNDYKKEMYNKINAGIILYKYSFCNHLILFFSIIGGARYGT